MGSSGGRRAECAEHPSSLGCLALSSSRAHDSSGVTQVKTETLVHAFTGRYLQRQVTSSGYNACGYLDATRDLTIVT